jgi:hypothetical protein
VYREEVSPKKANQGKKEVIIYSAGIVFSRGQPPGERKKKEITTSPRTRWESPKNRSIVKGVPDGNCAPLSWSKRPYWDCRGGVERALRQDAKTDATAVASSALFIQFTGRFIL